MGIYRFYRPAVKAVRRVSIGCMLQQGRFASSRPPNTSIFRISDEVRSALASNQPVVALETAIFTHGFPQPDNWNLAVELEATVRKQGAVPATIGIFEGAVCVGLSSEELQTLCSLPSERLTKFSRRDLPFLSTRTSGRDVPRHGGTTVAGTMALAHRAGIRVFATGGIGGVHRGAETTFDISADLVELGRTPVAVVCSGCKGFLDIPKTLEYLETQGVPVVTISANESINLDFPAFWSSSSGIKSPMTSHMDGIGQIIRNLFESDPRTGMLLANPIAVEHEISPANMKAYIDEALSSAASAGRSGRDNTPFVLSKINELSQGLSKTANRALVLSNARVAAVLARQALPKDQSITATTNGIFSTSTSIDQGHIISARASETVDVVAAGSIAIDRSCDPSPSSTVTKEYPVMRTSNPAKITESIGGVGYNLARAAGLCGARVQLFSKVGADLSGTALTRALDRSVLVVNDADTILIDSRGRTAQYIAINDTGKDLAVAAADMAIFESVTELEKQKWARDMSRLNPKAVIIDANWSSEVLRFWLDISQTGRMPDGQGRQIYFEPVSTAKATRLLSALQDKDGSFAFFPRHLVDTITPNELELDALWLAADNAGAFDTPEWQSAIDLMDLPVDSNDSFTRIAGRDLVKAGIPQKCIQLLPFCSRIIVTLGAQGVLVVEAIVDPASTLFTDASMRKNIVARPGNLGGNKKPCPIHGVFMKLYKPKELMEADAIVSVNGAGDTFLGALAAASSLNLHDSPIEFGQAAAALTLRSTESVSPDVASLAR